MKALVAIALAGCMTHASPSQSDPPLPGDPTDSADPHSCAEHATLAGIPGTTTSAAFTLGTASVGWCLALDGTANAQAAHFQAMSPGVAGEASGVTFDLVDATTAADLIDGWDVTVGTRDPHTRANLEWDVPAGTTATVILRARATETTTDTLTVSLFEPLD